MGEAQRAPTVFWANVQRSKAMLVPWYARMAPPADPWLPTNCVVPKDATEPTPITTAPAFDCTTHGHLLGALLSTHVQTGALDTVHCEHAIHK
jgi:hypothetical protein